MRSLCLLAVAVLAATGCNKDYPNPFVNANTTAVPPPGATILFTSDAYVAGSPREIYAVGDDGSALTRLTVCSASASECDIIEVAPGPDRKRVAVRRRATNSSNASLVFLDLARGVEGQLLPASAQVSGVDWSPTDDILVYSAAGTGGTDDLYRMDVNGQNQRALTTTGDVKERRPRVDPTGSVAVYEQFGTGSKSQIWIFQSSINEAKITEGGPGTDLLAGTPYVVGSDADPQFSPDGRSVVFRRLTATGNGGLGTWDVMTVGIDGTGLKVVATGPVYHGAPDWSSKGIVFAETDASANATRLVVIQSDGSGRKVAASFTGNVTISFPRWIP